jgi:exodeoxyribonuclease V alpha subunit
VVQAITLSPETLLKPMSIAEGTFNSKPPQAETSLDHPAFSALDRQFARLLQRLSGEANPSISLAAALVSHQQTRGDICLDLNSIAGTEFLLAPESDPIQIPALAPWVDALGKSSVVGSPGEFKPLILDSASRLYLHRYWIYEHQLAQSIQQRAASSVTEIDRDILKTGLKRFFPNPPGKRSEIDWQKVAAFAALRSRFCVISGGPGTGKTRTVVLLLALLLEQNPALRIAVAAPTGKAAARLQESIKKTMLQLDCAEEIKERLPSEAVTLHRLLGFVPDSPSPRFTAANPLAADVVVVDEASMVDLALMAKLFAAVPPKARLVLLGDKDQLASVEAGAVLGDVCLNEAVRSFSPEFAASFENTTGEEFPANRISAKASPLADAMVHLETNYRFGGDTHLLRLSRAINDGDADTALNLLSGSKDHGLSGVPLPCPEKLKRRLQDKVIEHFTRCLQAPSPAAALEQLGRFRILCVLRQGPYGVVALNKTVEEILREAGLIPPPATWYPGRPVMITRNDYNLKLFNGDIGLFLPDPESGEHRVFFPGPDNTVRKFLHQRLPEHETVHAMTVHKSQGSEFEEVLLVLPDRESPVLTRELIYTGLTRASQSVELWFTPAVLRMAIARQIRRASGLRDSLWGAPPIQTAQTGHENIA